MSRPSRRAFLCSATTASLAAGVADLSFLGGLLQALPDAALPAPGSVRFAAEIEPLVQLLEQTPSEQVLEVFGARIQGGTSYADVLAALHLAGIRNIPPRPDTGWKFHCVLVLHSAHLASQELPSEDRWLPIFFALDFFKRQQAYDERESEWTMSAVLEDDVPELRAAPTAFAQAMEAWDDAAADAAVTSMARSYEAQEVFESFAFYGMRDFRYTGHKAIYTANSWRTLEYLGWPYAEPMLRSLVYAQLNHSNEPNPAEHELEPDAPWRHNRVLARSLADDWRTGRVSAAATVALLETLRSGTWAEASGKVVELLGKGVAPQSIQDALFLGAVELLVRQPNILSLHGVTATNALAYLYRTTRIDHTRQLLLLQNASHLVQFREFLKERGPWGDARVDELQPSPLEASGPGAPDEIFELVGQDPLLASRKTLAHLEADGQNAVGFLQAARCSSALKCKNGHDYKFSSAIVEDYAHVSPAWRARYLAASVYYLRGHGDLDNPLMGRTRAALEG